MSTTIESLELRIQSDSTSAVKGIEALSASLSKLKSVTKGGVGLNSVANQVRNLDTALRGLDGSAVSKIDRLMNSLSALSRVKVSSSIANQLKSIEGATTSLKTADFSNIERLSLGLASLASVSKATGLQSVVTQLAKLPELSRKMNDVDWGQFIYRVEMLSNSFGELNSKLNMTSNVFNKVSTVLDKTKNRTKSLATVNKMAADSYVNLWAKARMAKNVVQIAAQVIAKWVTESNAYVENLNLFTASMGDYASEAKKYAEQVGEIMGIDPGEFMRNQGIFMSITEGFGVASDRAYIMSKNLTQLGYDLSSFFNISFEDSMQKLTSGISGELEPLRRLGYDLSEARLKAIALSLGIQKSFQNMTQAEKAQIRYYAIMTQVTKAQGDMSRTLEAPANQLRILQAQVTQCSRALGNIFIPILNMVLPYAIALVKVIRMLADSFSKLTGFKLPEVDYSGIKTSSNAVGSLAKNADNAENGLGKVAKKAKKLKDALLGIDELNIISENNDDDKGLGGLGDKIAGGGDLGFELPQYDFLTGAVNAKVDEIVSMIQGAMSEIEAVLSTFFLVIGTILVITGANIPLGLGLMALGAVGLAKVVVENWDGMSERLAKVLTMLFGVLSGFFLVIGALLIFTGVNIPLGIGLMAIGAAALGVAATINWKFLEGNLKNVLSILMAAISTAVLVIGAVLAFSGAGIPLGIGLMIVGAAGLATAVGLNWKGLSEPMKKALTVIASIVGGALIALGLILILSGAGIPLGIGLLIAGAVAIASAVALNWDDLKNDLGKSLSKIVELVKNGALIGVGLMLALTGAATPLGIALIAMGAVNLAKTNKLEWNFLKDKIKKVLKEIGIAVGLALIALGAILTLTAVGLPQGIALMVAGAASLISGIALNWDTIVKKIKTVLKKIATIAGKAMIAIGVLFCLTGVGIPLGLALIAGGLGLKALGEGVKWNDIVKKVDEGLNAIGNKFSKFKEKVRNKLDQTKESISNWADGIKDSISKGKNALSNIGDKGAELGERMLKGVGKSFTNANSWVNDHIITPIDGAIKNARSPEFEIALKNTASTWWNNAKIWWKNNSKEGLTIKSGIELVKKGWTSVTSWVGKIPIVKQGVNLAKSGWNTVTDLIGRIPDVKQGVNLVKSGWDNVKQWIGKIPTLSQSINLIKSGWESVKNWIGSLPVISQLVKLGKSGWQTVKNWIGSIPVIAQGISLFKSGWQTIKNWINERNVATGISLFKNGWTSLKSWIGDNISVGVSLVKKGWYSLRSFFGLSTGGYDTGHGFKMFKKGGFIKANGKSSFWDSIPMYANGTSNARLHGSMFVAGESGAEMVGHINGQTEVLNQSQIKLAMRSAVISGMAQFVGYWRVLNSQLAVCTNAVISSMTMNTNALSATLADNSQYEFSKSLSQSVYSDSQQSSDNFSQDDSWSRMMKEFYTEYLEPTLKGIASDTKRQADKQEQTIVQIGSRTITDVVTAQKEADGFVFTK